MKPRVCMVIHSYYPLIGGAETYAQGLAERLAERGYGVVVLTIRPPRTRRKESINSVKVIRISAPNMPGLRFIMYSLGFSLYMLRHRKSIGIIHSYQTFTAGFMAAILGKLLRKPTILREGAESITLLKDSRNPIKRLTMKFTAGATGWIYPTNPKAALIFLDLGAAKEKLDVLWTPIDADVFRPSKDRDALRKSMGLDKKFALLFVGRLVGFKNVGCLISAVPLLVNEIPNLIVLIAGSGPDEEGLKSQVGSLGVSRYVRFLGRVPFSDVSRYYQAADVLVHPALAKIPDRSFPSQTVFQAMSSKLPVVSTSDHQFFKGIMRQVSTMKEMEAGIAVKPDSPEWIARAVLKLYKSPNLRSRLGKAGRRVAVDELNWDRHIRKIVEKYRLVQRLSRTKK